MTSTSDYHITCLCGAVRESGTLLDSPTIPTSSPELCHCNPCRYTTGALGGSFPRLRGVPTQASLDACVAYDSSLTHTRYHCGACGSSTFVHAKGDDHWICLGGVIEPADGSGNEKAKDVVRIETHDFVGDVADGGLVSVLAVLGGRAISRWETSPGEREVGMDEVKQREARSIEKAKEKPAVDETLQVKCHCGGVDLRLRRADFANDSQGFEDQDIPPDKDKYMAQFCVCRSCRLATGVSAQPWCFVPPANVTIASTGKTIQVGKDAEAPGANEGTTLKHFKSSSNVYRSFCGTCGATVFYRDDGPGSSILNISVGLLRAEEGAMARRWLAWCWGNIAWQEEAIDSEILEALLGEEEKKGIQQFE